MRNLLRNIVGFPATLMIACITAYQHTLSPDHGPLRHLWKYGYCRHSPTCSEYAKNVIRDRGAVIGGLLAAKRLLTCNPFRKPDAERIMDASHGTT